MTDNASDNQLDRLRAALMGGLPTDNYDATELLAALHANDADAVSTLLDGLNPAERLGTLHALLFTVHAVQSETNGETYEGVLRVAAAEGDAS